jgi:hypothetical protein
MIDPIVKIKFYKLWSDALENGFTSAEAREYASLELFGESFVKNQK